MCGSEKGGRKCAAREEKRLESGREMEKGEECECYSEEIETRRVILEQKI